MEGEGIFKKLGKQANKTTNKISKTIKNIDKNIDKTVEKVNNIKFKFGDIVENKANEIKDSVVKKVNQSVNLADKIIFGTDELPPYVLNYIKQNGKLEINSLTLARAPVPKIIYKFLDTVSNVKQKVLYHLFLIIELSNGKKVLIEKNERINISTKIPKPSEILNVEGNFDFNLEQMINNTKTKMGKHLFSSYNANSNNCQVFIVNILESNNLINSSYREFIKQDTQDIFNNKPILRGVANTVTNEIGSRFNILKNGGSINDIKTKKLNSKAINMRQSKMQIENDIQGEGINFKKAFSKKNVKRATRTVGRVSKKVSKDALKEVAKNGIAAAVTYTTGNPIVGDFVAEETMKRTGANRKIDGMGVNEKPERIGAQTSTRYALDKIASKKLKHDVEQRLNGGGINPFNSGGGFMPV